MRKIWRQSEGSTPDYWESVLPSGEFIKQATTQAQNSTIAPIILSNIQQGHRILDAGCGPMIWSPLITEKGAKYFGLDYSTNLVKQGIKVNAHVLPRPIVGNVAELPCRNNAFDMYLSLGILEHFREGMKIHLNECARVLKPGCIACISVPYLNWLRRIFLPFEELYRILRKCQFLRRLLGKKTAPVEIFYQYAFSLTELRRIMNSSGLKIFKIVPFEWEYGLVRDYRCLRKIQRRNPKIFQKIARLCERISPYLCPHMILIIAEK